MPKASPTGWDDNPVELWGTPVNSHSPNWPYPGSRWWKFDIHAHTPASLDTNAWQSVKGTRNELTPEQWLLKYMQAGIDCVAVTDHNTGDWIDKLKSAYAAMQKQANESAGPEDFRELVLFPGVEISVSCGFHLLAIFGPEATRRTISDLLATVRYKGTDGGCDGITERSAVDVIRAVLDAGGIPIPAHSDQKNGLLRTGQGASTYALDQRMVRQVMENEGVLAVEWLDLSLPVPAGFQKEISTRARVLGSDCHSFHGKCVPGSSFTWIKMADPTLNGLRLALLDGDGISVRRSDEGPFNPFQTPAHFVASIEVESARFMGNGHQQRLNFTPFCNALIGGRGTGKSTIVHALRLVYRRDKELQFLGNTSEPCHRFISFAKTPNGRDADGGLRDNTRISVVLSRDGALHRLWWRQDDDHAIVVEDQGKNGEWQTSASQAVTTERFPVRLFSQGQIADMAGENRQALLDIMDEAADTGELHNALERAKRTYLSQQAQLREMDGHLNGRSELERKLTDLNHKLATVAQSDHSEILNAHRRSLRQRREVEMSLQQLREMPNRINAFTHDLLLDDWSDGTFDPAKDHGLIIWKDQAIQVLDEAGKALTKTARNLQEKVNHLSKDVHIEQWRQSVDRSEDDYRTMQSDLAKQGITSPMEIERIVINQRQLEKQLNQLAQLQRDRDQLAEEIESQRKKILHARRAVTQARQKFVRNTLATNKFVQIEVVEFGFEAHKIERSLRDLLDCQDDRFADDFLQIDDGEPVGGMAFELVRSGGADRDGALERIKQGLINQGGEFRGHFRNFLRRKFATPEFGDRVNCWFPDDDLRITYSRTADGDNWVPISQGSQGQRAASLLAFLLAFGNEPLVLDQPEDDLDNHLIYDLVVRQIRENKMRRQLIIATHNPNIVVNGDAEMVHALDFHKGQCRVKECGALQETSVREEVCQVMEGGREAFTRRWARLGRGV